MTITQEADRIHVFTNSYEWTLMKTVTDERGFGSISDVRHKKTGQVILTDRPGWSINDPRFGALFSFGVIIAEPPTIDAEPPTIDPARLDPTNFWNWAWELTSKRNGISGKSQGYGLRNTKLTVRKDNSKVTCTATLAIHKLDIAKLTWNYTFADNDAVACKFKISTLANKGLFWKEPKVVANGLHGYRYVTARTFIGNVIPPERYDLYTLPDPTKKTHQIGSDYRFSVDFIGDSQPITITSDRGFDQWYRDANSQPPMSDQAIHVDGSFGPAGKYCMPKNQLLEQWECPHWPNENIAGLCFHVWEGGYGAPDCWNCFRPLPAVNTSYNNSFIFRFDT